MTTNRTTTVTHADGTTTKRTSKTRAYAYAIEIAPAPADKAGAALIAAATEAAARAAQCRTAAVIGRVTIASRGFKTIDDMVSHQATLAGTDRQTYTWCNANGQTRELESEGGGTTDVRTYLVRSALEIAKHYDEEAAAKTAEAIAVLTAGEPVGEYGVLRWSKSADLAHRALAEFEYAVKAGHTLRVVPVDPEQ